MNWYQIFYWLSVSDKVINFFDVLSNVFTWFAGISFCAFVISWVGRSVSLNDTRQVDKDEDIKNYPLIRAWNLFGKISMSIFYTSLFLSIVSWAGYVFTPSKKDCIMIIAGGAVGNFLSSDTSAKQLPSDLTKYLHLSLKKEVSDLGLETRKELGLLSPSEEAEEKAKDELVKKASNMTKEEIIELLKKNNN